MSVRDLLTAARRILVELRRRGVVRTDNAPLGDVAENVVCAAYGGTLAPNSERSFDLIDAANRTVQVKARSIAGGQSGAQLFSPFRTFEFDVAVFLVFDRDSMDLLSAVEVSADAVRESSTYKPHVNGHVTQVRKILANNDLGTDVFDRVQGAYSSL